MLIERRSNSTTSLHVGGTRKYSFEFCIENCKNASETIDFNRGYMIYFKNGNVVIILCSIQIMQYQGQMTNYNIIKVTYTLVLQWMLLFGVSCCTFESEQYHTRTFCFQKHAKKKNYNSNDKQKQISGNHLCCSIILCQKIDWFLNCSSVLRQI